MLTLMRIASVCLSLCASGSALRATSFPRASRLASGVLVRRRNARVSFSSMFRRFAVLGLMFAVIGSPVAAQGDGESLQEMLRYVPETTLSSDSLVTYVDYRAVERARSGAGMPRSFEAWSALESAQLDQWIAAFGGVISGSGFLQVFGSTGADWPTVVGFDFFDTAQELHFGAPPQDGLIVVGGFDPATITAAHEARGFASMAERDGTLICGAAGCDAGLAVDLSAREPADPFGGALGRQQPLFVAPDMLLSSAHIDTLRSMLDAVAGGSASLADVPEVRTALASLPAGARLRQLAFVPVRSIAGDAPATEESPAAHALPPYSVALFADTATSEEQVAHVVLIFASSEDAQAAARIIPARIDEVVSLYRDETLREQLDRRGVTAVDVRVVEPGDEGGVAVDVAMHAPLAGADASTPDARSSGVYGHLMATLFQRDAPWLATS